MEEQALHDVQACFFLPPKGKILEAKVNNAQVKANPTMMYCQIMLLQTGLILSHFQCSFPARGHKIRYNYPEAYTSVPGLIEAKFRDHHRANRCAQCSH